jgi:hypothetical protein
MAARLTSTKQRPKTDDPLDDIDWCVSNVRTAADMALWKAHEISHPDDHPRRERLVFIAHMIGALVERLGAAAQVAREARP